MHRQSLSRTGLTVNAAPARSLALERPPKDRGGLPYENSGDENDISKVLDLLEKHPVGATNEIYESYKFFQRSQEDGRL